jgi:hypothetical protein
MSSVPMMGNPNSTDKERNNLRFGGVQKKRSATDSTESQKDLTKGQIHCNGSTRTLQSQTTTFPPV